MHRKNFSAVVVGAALCLLAGCGESAKVRSKEQIAIAIRDHLRIDEPTEVEVLSIDLAAPATWRIGTREQSPVDHGTHYIVRARVGFSDRQAAEATYHVFFADKGGRIEVGGQCRE